ncbi:MAG: LacI family DNA-binding transcriptional regulator [Caldilineaceae bacterium]|nr:LacI family DNA-binding transcriptional regulator [Caldilineaceae bacterium]
MAGVSRATVSYVINNRTDIAITNGTRSRVLDAVAKLNYAPDARAQSLRSGGSNAVGLLIPDLHNPHYWSIVQGVEDTVRENGYDLLLTSTSLNPEREARTLAGLTGRRVDALILILSFLEQSKTSLTHLAANAYPVVTLGNASLNVDAVVTTYRTATAQIMAHLLQLGHTRIGFIFGVGSKELATNRMEVYEQSLAAAGIPIDKSLIDYSGPRIEDGYQAAQRLLSRTPRPTALLVINDWLAIGALRAVGEAGLRLPEDISVASFDDTEMAAFLNPPLTSVRSNGYTLGSEAATLALERIRQPDRPIRRVQIEAELVVRGSTGPAARGQ